MTRRRRTLRPEERALWHKVAETAVPMHPRRKPSTPEPDLPGTRPKAPAKAATPVPRFRLGEGAAGEAAGHDLAPALADRLAQQPLGMDRKTFGRMKRGKLGVEGRLDLHGMTLAEAHPRLVEFILSAQAGGKRLVLVITGKGKSGDEAGPIPARRGILRHQVPQWLQLPPLRAAVLQVAEAHRSHGGGGAYYVYLRRTR
ncbi:MAG: Smr/MutS family protein [Tranquillimonas sp.]